MSKHGTESGKGEATQDTAAKNASEETSGLAGEEQKPVAEAVPSGTGAGTEEQDQVADEIATLTDQMTRLRADFDNLRRRTRREQGEMKDRVRAEMMESLLPVMDHFELGLAAAAEDASTSETIRQGFQMVYDQLGAVLREAGVAPIDAEGQPFDPQVHESIAHLPSDQHPDGTVSKQTRRGYRLGSLVLRPAQVVVSSGPAPATAGAGNGE